MTQPDHTHETPSDEAAAGCVLFVLVMFAMAIALFNAFGFRDGIRDGAWHDAVCSVAVCETPTPGGE